MKHNERVYLRHILDAIAQKEEYTRNLGIDTFYRQRLIQDGFIRQLEIIGEAVRRISNDTLIKYPNVPWQDIPGMRDKLIHDYFGVDLEYVWLTLKEDIPPLKQNISLILKG